MMCQILDLLTLVATTFSTAQFDLFGSIANFFNPSSNNVNSNDNNNNSDGPRGRGCAGGGNPPNYK